MDRFSQIAPYTAAGLGIERRKLADERARLAGEDPAPRKPEPPQAEQKRPRGHKH